MLRPRDVYHYSLGILYWSLFTIAILLGLATSRDSYKDKPTFYAAACGAAPFIPLVGLFVAVQPVVKHAQTDSVAKKKAWNAIHNALDNLQSHLFSQTPGGPHEHRVTLYLKVSFAWPCWHGRHDSAGIWRGPCSGWLVPIVRSGNTTQNLKTVFWAPDIDPERSEGIAGLTWKKDDVIFVTGLPKLGMKSAVAKRKLYADKTNVTPSWVDDRLSRGYDLRRSFLGIPIEVNGSPRGVIVIDCQEPNLPMTLPDREKFLMIGRMFGHMLEGIIR